MHRSMEASEEVSSPADAMAEAGALLVNVCVDERALAPGCVFHERPDLALAFEPLVPVEDGPLPLLWAGTPDHSAASVDELLERSALVQSYERFSDRGEDRRHLYRVDWRHGIQEVVGPLLESGAHPIAIESPAGTTSWSLRLLLDSRRDYLSFLEAAAAENVPVTIESVHEPGG